MSSLAGLFTRHFYLRAVVEAVLQGNQGSIRTFEKPPRAARLDLGCYAVPGGDPSAPAARRLLAELTGPLELAVPDDDRWRQLLTEMFGSRVRDRSMRAYVGGQLADDRLASLAGTSPAGYEIVPLDARHAAALDEALSPHGVDVFGGPDRFSRSGFGFCALRADVPVCAASTYALARDKAEVAIATRQEHRGRGLATAVSAAMLGECRRRGLEPHWNAYNPVSQRLAERLGLTPVGICEILMLDG
jgi:GNAT superfamily N-acetyltransferase